jgi:hypothetical protein
VDKTATPWSSIRCDDVRWLQYTIPPVAIPPACPTRPSIRLSYPAVAASRPAPWLSRPLHSWNRGRVSRARGRRRATTSDSGRGGVGRRYSLARAGAQNTCAIRSYLLSGAAQAPHARPRGARSPTATIGAPDRHTDRLPYFDNAAFARYSGCGHRRSVCTSLDPNGRKEPEPCSTNAHAPTGSLGPVVQPRRLAVRRRWPRHVQSQMASPLILAPGRSRVPSTTRGSA